jgi:hypothetical protein
MMRDRRLSDGQVVTLLVGIALELLPLHESGHAYGPIHPAHVRLDATGRPQLVDVVAPPGWTPHDDWVSLLRLGRHVGASEWAETLSWEAVGGLEGVELLQWLMRWVDPQPL